MRFCTDILKVANSPWFCRKFPENKSFHILKDLKFSLIMGILSLVMLNVIRNISLLVVKNLPDYKMQMLAGHTRVGHINLFQ